MTFDVISSNERAGCDRVDGWRHTLLSTIEHDVRYQWVINEKPLQALQAVLIASVLNGIVTFNVKYFGTSFVRTKTLKVGAAFHLIIARRKYQQDQMGKSQMCSILNTLKN